MTDQNLHMGPRKPTASGTSKEGTPERTTSVPTKSKPSTSSKVPKIEESTATLVRPSRAPAPPTAPNGRVRKRILLSDEDDEGSEPPKASTVKAEDSPPKKRKSIVPETSDDGSIAGVSKKLKSSRLMVTSDEDGDIGVVGETTGLCAVCRD